MEFKKGDRVLLNVLGVCPPETTNWAKRDVGTNWAEPQIVSHEAGMGNWVILQGSSFGHPKEKFLKLEEV